MIYELTSAVNAKGSQMTCDKGCAVKNEGAHWFRQVFGRVKEHAGDGNVTPSKCVSLHSRQRLRTRSLIKLPATLRMSTTQGSRHLVDLVKVLSVCRCLGDDNQAAIIEACPWAFVIRG
jgi:hypothetical protein